MLLSYSQGSKKLWVIIKKFGPRIVEINPTTDTGTVEAPNPKGGGSKRQQKKQLHFTSKREEGNKRGKCERREETKYLRKEGGEWQKD